MNTNYLPPLRNNQQMVRVVKESGANAAITSHTYKLGNAFGEGKDSVNASLFSEQVLPTEQRLRTLEVMALPSGSLRRPGADHSGGILPIRATSSHYHQLNTSTRSYFNGLGDNQIQSRQELASGTKLRTQLTPWSDNKHVYKNSCCSTLSHIGSHSEPAKHGRSHRQNHRISY